MKSHKEWKRKRQDSKTCCSIFLERRHSRRTCNILRNSGDGILEGRGPIPREALALLVNIPIVVSTCFKLPTRQGLQIFTTEHGIQSSLPYLPNSHHNYCGQKCQSNMLQEPEQNLKNNLSVAYGLRTCPSS